MALSSPLVVVLGRCPDVESQPLGQGGGDELAPDAVARRVETGRVDPEAALAGRGGDDPALTPLLPGSPMSNSQSPERSYSPVEAMTANTLAQVDAVTTRSLVTGFTPPSARVAPITARSRAETTSEH
jgi:hypothetical protein